MAGGRDPLVLRGAAGVAGRSGQLSQGLSPSGLNGAPGCPAGPLPPAAPRLRLPGPCPAGLSGVLLPSFSGERGCSCVDRGPHAGSGLGGASHPVLAPGDRAKINPAQTQRGSTGLPLGWAGPGAAAEWSPRCSGPRVSELSLRATLKATGLWEAHVLALPPSQSRETGVAGQPCLRDRRTPHAGRTEHPARTVFTPFQACQCVPWETSFSAVLVRITGLLEGSVDRAIAAAAVQVAAVSLGTRVRARRAGDGARLGPRRPGC